MTTYVDSETYERLLARALVAEAERDKARGRIAELERERDATAPVLAEAQRIGTWWRKKHDLCHDTMAADIDSLRKERDEARAQLDESQASAATMRESLGSMVAAAEEMASWDWPRLLIDGLDSEVALSDWRLLEHRLHAARSALAPNAGRDLLAEREAERAEVAALREVADAARRYRAEVQRCAASDDECQCDTYCDGLDEHITRLDALTAGAPKEVRSED